MKVSNDSVQQVINPVPKTGNTPQTKAAEVKAEEAKAVEVKEATKNNTSDEKVGKNINIYA